MLKDLNGPTDTPWLVMGDFNVVLYTNEKAGGKPYCWVKLKTLEIVSLTVVY